MQHDTIPQIRYPQENISVSGDIDNQSCEGCSHKVDNQTLTTERAYYQTLHRMAVQRESKLKEEIEQLKAKLRLRERQLFGRKSEKSAGTKNDSEGN